MNCKGNQVKFMIYLKILQKNDVFCKKVGFSLPDQCKSSLYKYEKMGGKIGSGLGGGGLVGAAFLFANPIGFASLGLAGICCIAALELTGIGISTYYSYDLSSNIINNKENDKIIEELLSN